MSTSGDGGKPFQTGLVDMGDIAFYVNPSQPVPVPVTLAFLNSEFGPFPGLFSEIVLNVTWAQLQPDQGGAADPFSVIQDAINAVTAYNSQNDGMDLGIKLRVWGGFTAPEWAKSINGPPIPVTDKAGHPQTIGRFWTADYIDAWTSFQNALAARYDSNPVIRGISNTAGASETDEPFIPPQGGAGQLQAAAGYTDAAQQLTLRAAIADYSQWSTTPLDYTMNLFHTFDGGQENGDANFTLAVLQQARNSTRVVQAGNHALNSPWPSADAFIYAQMQADGALDPAAVPGSFQTASPDVLGFLPLPPIPNDYPTFTGAYWKWPYAVVDGVAANAGDIELWDGPGTTGFTGLSPSQVQLLAAIVAAGNAPLTGAPDDGSALGFIAPAFATGAPGTVAFSGTDAVLIASATVQGSYSVTLTSMNGGTLAVTDPMGIVIGPTSGPTLSLSGPLLLVNTVLASLTDTLQSGTDIVQISVTDSSGNVAVRDVGVQISAPAASSGASPPGDVVGPSIAEITDRLADSGILVVGGVQSSLVVPGDLEIGGAGNNATLLAALAPSAYSTASLTVGGTLEVLSGGTAHFAGTLGAGAVRIDSGGAVSGNGTLSAAGGGPIVNDGTLEAAADLTLGLQQLTVTNAIAGTGRMIIDPGASLILQAAVGPDQVIDFAPGSITQFANDLYSPTTLVLAAPHGMMGTITGFSFASSLVLEGVTAATANGVTYDHASGILTVTEQNGSSLTFHLSGDLVDLQPSYSTSAGSPSTTVTFVAPPAGLRPHVVAPATLQGAAGMSVLVPDIVLHTPLPASSTGVSQVTVTLSTDAGGVLAAGDDNGNTTVSFLPNGDLFLSGTVGAVERSLQTLTYTAAAGSPTDTIRVRVANDAGESIVPAAISVFNNSAPSRFDWAFPTSGSFNDPGNWTAGVVGPPAPPGGADVAAFGPGIYTVSGNGAVGQIVATGRTTLTGQVTAQATGVSLIVDSNGALTLAGGAQLTAQGQATVGTTGQGLLTLMGGALALTGAPTANALVIGEAAGSDGTVVNLEQITANGTVVVGQAGSGTLALLGVASTVTGGGADIGQAPGAQGTAIVNGGYWATSGQLTVGDGGNGALLIDGAANGIAGQVTAFDATIGNQAGSQGSVTLDGGLLLVANVNATSSTLIVGASGTGSLVIENGSEVAVGTAAANNNGSLVVGGADGGRGLIRVGSYSALLVYGDAVVGDAGVGEVTVGTDTDQNALFATYGMLTVGATGQVTLGGAGAVLRADTFEIASGGLVSGWGTLSGLLGGNSTVQLASIDNDGSIVANGGDLLLYGSVTGTGELSIGTDATLTFQAAVESGQTLVFGSNSNAVLNDPRAFAGTITGFGSDDVLKLASTTATSASWSDGVLTVEGDFSPIQLRVAGNYAPDSFTVQSDGLGGTNVAGGYGDVHMVTFAGLRYDFQAVGEFVAVRSTGPGTPWQIQIETKGIHGVASITTELAAMLGDDWVTFAIGRGNVVHVDGMPDSMLHIGAVQNLAGGTLAQLSSKTWQLTWNAGQSVTVTDHGDWLDWAVGLGPHDGPGSVQGLLGSNNGQATDFQLPDGTVLPQPLSNEEIVGLFADAWRVAPDDDLLGYFARHSLIDA